MTQGIHHITMIAGDPQENLDFYAGTLGMRLVKISVNQDDPETYHFFYGDAHGSPGSDITFFPYRHGRRAMPGAGAVSEITLAIPLGATDYWKDRFHSLGIEHRTDVSAFGEARLLFHDHDGLSLALQETNDLAKDGWPGMIVPREYAITRSPGVRISTATGTPETLDSTTNTFIEEFLGWPAYTDIDRTRRYEAPDGSWIDVESTPRAPYGRGGIGGVHHVAFRVETADEQEEIHKRLVAAGANVSDLIDRLWFRSIYFREPGGVLFEIATDGPGFTLDESFESLGKRISLPPWLEERRELIERSLPKVEFPTVGATR